VSADARRAARASWEVAICRPPPASSASQRAEERAKEEESDDLFWLRVPEDERARLTWDLSRELYSLAARNRGVYDEEIGSFVDVERGDLERRLPRAAFVVTRR
jgi:hypothetical protein